MIQDGGAAFAWWRDLRPDSDRDRDRAGNRAALARLRRCATVAEAMLEPATIRLFARVRATGPADLPRVALAAAVLAHLREDGVGHSVARAIGPESIDRQETALLKPLRFRRLLEAADGDERLTAFRRLLALAGGRLPAADLARSLLDWDEGRRRRWILDYWQAAPASAAVPRDPTLRIVSISSEDRPA